MGSSSMLSGQDETGLCCRVQTLISVPILALQRTRIICKHFASQRSHKEQNKCTSLHQPETLSKVRECFETHPAVVIKMWADKKRRKIVCNTETFDFHSVCVNTEKQRPCQYKGWVLYQSCVCCWMWYPEAVHFQSAWAICFTYLQREREKRKNKQLYHAFSVYAALARGMDSFIRSMWSALTLTGQRGLAIWLNWNIILDVIVCDMQL